MRAVFVDTWGWLTLADPREPKHAELMELRVRHLSEGIRWLTTDYVLDETFTRIFQRVPAPGAQRFSDGLFTAHKAGALAIEFITPERFAAAYRLRIKFSDKPNLSFTDLTSFAVMRELHITQAVTGDAHFQQVNLGFAMVPSA